MKSKRERVEKSKTFETEGEVHQNDKKREINKKSQVCTNNFKSVKKINVGIDTWEMDCGNLRNVREL